MAGGTLIVEDDAGMRATLADAAGSIAACVPVVCAGTLAEGLDALAKARPRLLLVDLGLPDGNGVELIRRGAALDPAPNILVVSVLGDEQHVVGALAAGANGYLLKGDTQPALCRAIEQVLAGDAPISPAIAVHVLRRLRGQQPGVASTSSAEAADAALSPREIEILELASKGLPHAEIGSLLGLRYSTVVSYVREIYRKLAVHSRAQALFEARQLGLLHDP